MAAILSRGGWAKFTPKEDMDSHMQTLIIKALALIQYKNRKSNFGDKSVIRSSYFHNGISYTGKNTSMYWIRALLMPPARESAAMILILFTWNTPIRKSKDYVYGIWGYKVLGIWKGYYRVKKSLVSCMKPWNEARNNKYMKYHSKLTYQCQNQEGPRYQVSWGQHGAHLGSTGPRWAQYWPHEPCYLGLYMVSILCWSGISQMLEKVTALHTACLSV